MKNIIEAVKESIDQVVLTDAGSIEAFRIQYLGSKGEIKNLFGELKNVPNDQKKAVGQELNALRQLAESKWASAKEQLDSAGDAGSDVDVTRPGEPMPLGARHPLSLVRSEIISIFERIGYTVSELTGN